MWKAPGRDSNRFVVSGGAVEIGWCKMVEPPEDFLSVPLEYFALDPTTTLMPSYSSTKAAFDTCVVFS